MAKLDLQTPDYQPDDCCSCCFWQGRRKGCSEPACVYLDEQFPTEHNANEVMAEPQESCDNCPYGRASPCIGYCIREILQAMWPLK